MTNECNEHSGKSRHLKGKHKAAIIENVRESSFKVKQLVRAE